MDHPKPWLRYIGAGKVADRTLDLDGMKVRNVSGENLGEVDGLIVDSDSGRTYYVVVDGPGWFMSKQYLLPIGQAHLSPDREALVADLTREQVNRFPGFDKDEFDRLTETDVKRINDQIGQIFEPGVAYAADEPYYAAWSRRSFEYPDWWTAEPTLPERMGASAFEKPVDYPAASSMPPRRERSPEVVERVEVHDASPHFDGRAQPGDVLGIETSGEETHVGETKADEDSRRRSAQRENKK